MRTTHIVAVKVNDLVRTELWDGSRPIRLGYQMPWTLSKNQEGYFLKHTSGHTLKFKESVINERREVRLPTFEEDKSEPLTIQILPAQLLPSMLSAQNVLPEGESASVDAVWCMVESTGSTVYDTQAISEMITVRQERRRLFTLKPGKTGFTLEIQNEAVKLKGVARLASENIRRDSSFELVDSELGLLTIEYGLRSWTFKRIRKEAAPIAGKLEIDPESLWFKKAYRNTNVGVAVAFMLAFLTTFIAPTEEKEEEKLQFARIEISRDRLPVSPAEAPREVQPMTEQKTDVAVNAPQVKNPAPAPLDTPSRDRSKSGKPAKAESPSKMKKPGPISVQTVANAEPKESAAISKVKQLQKSMAGLMALKNNLLADSPKQGGSVFQGERAAVAPGSSGVTSFGKQNLQVAYTTGGSENGTNGANYRMGTTQGEGKGARGSSFVSVGTDDGVLPTVAEGLSKKEVWDVINKHMHEIRYCYETSILKKPSIEGKVLVGFTIGKRGSVESTLIKASSVSDKELDQCVTKRLSSWQFPRPKGNVDVAVTYPFVFRRL
ncbi:MAG: TonB family protein [Bacteriovoracia bacterium]